MNVNDAALPRSCGFACTRIEQLSIGPKLGGVFGRAAAYGPKGTDQAFRHKTEISLRTLAAKFDKGTPLPVVSGPDELPCGGECMT